MKHDGNIDYKGVLVASSASISSLNAIQGISAAGNSVGAGTVVFSNANSVTFGMNANTVTMSASAGQSPVTFSGWPVIGQFDFPGMEDQAVPALGTTGGTGGSTQITVSGVIGPMPQQHGNIFYNLVRCGLSNSVAAPASTASVTEGMVFGLYTQSSQTMSLATSYAFNIRHTHNGSDAASYRWWWGSNINANSTSTALAANSDITSAFQGNRMAILSTGDGTIPVGSALYVGMLYSRRTSSQNALYVHTVWNRVTTAMCRSFGVASGASTYLNSFIGAFTTTTNLNGAVAMVMPDSIHVSVITTTPCRYPLISFVST